MSHWYTIWRNQHGVLFSCTALVEVAGMLLCWFARGKILVMPLKKKKKKRKVWIPLALDGCFTTGEETAWKSTGARVVNAYNVDSRHTSNWITSNRYGGAVRPYYCSVDRYQAKAIVAGLMIVDLSQWTWVSTPKRSLPRSRRTTAATRCCTLPRCDPSTALQILVASGKEGEGKMSGPK